MVKLTIQGMTCNHCMKSVTEALSKVPGVEKVVEVSLTRKEATVSGHPEAEQLVHAVKELGYDVQVAE